jgi:hypothetical protein
MPRKSARKTRSAKPPGESFPQFSLLPPELRARIWELALEDAVPDERMIYVSIYHRLHVSHHSCVTLGGKDAKFCGDVTHCASYSEGQRSHISMFMTDGFFATSDDFPEPDDPVTEDAIHRLSLVCIEARSAVTRRFPAAIRVHHGFYQVAKDGDDNFWYQTRFVRCNPARDWLVITQVPDMSVSHTTSSWQGTPNAERHQMLDSIFPDDDICFEKFRHVLSSFQKFAFAFMGDHRPEPGSALHETGELLGMNLPATSDFNTLLLFLESRTSLYMWPYPKYWKEVREEGTTMIVDVCSLGAFGNYPRVREFHDMTSKMEVAIADYNRSVAVHKAHSAPSDRYWVPRPKPLKYIGCFAARRWIKELGWETKVRYDTFDSFSEDGEISEISESDSESNSESSGGIVGQYGVKWRWT